MREKIDRYEVKSEIGRGGMATVFFAYDPRMQRDVAVKVLLRELLTAPQVRERFNREARIIAGLDHPAIVPVYDFGEDEGDPYIVMRFMGGGSLSDRIKKGALTLNEAGVVVHRIASALDRAHTMGLIHRDLKPGNILFDQYGSAFLSDFGIVKVVQEATNLTGTGAFFGTPHYMSPEQVVGEIELDGRSDIYALGVILYEMLTGSTPFSADTPLAIAFKHVYEEAPRVLDKVPGLPAETNQILEKALEKERDRRYNTAGEFAAELLRVAGVSVDDLMRSTGSFKHADVQARRDESTTQAVSPMAPVPTPPPMPMPPMTPLAARATAAGVDTPTVQPKKDTRPPTKPPVPLDPLAPLTLDEVKEQQALGSRKVPGWVWGVIGAVALLIIAAVVIMSLNRGGAEGELPALQAGTDEATEPSVVEEPTEAPTEEPTEAPTEAPTDESTEEPTEEPTAEPTSEPTEVPAASAAAGREILFAAGAGSRFDLFTMGRDGRLDGSDRQVVTEDTRNYRGPRWSPDGTKIVFRGQAANGNYVIYVLDMASGEITALTDDSGDSTQPAWSADGTMIAFVSDRDGNPEIYVMNADGSDQYRVTNDSQRDMGPTWSPDGTRVAFYTDRDGGYEIYSIGINGSDEVRLTMNGVADYEPAWSPDGSLILYTTEQFGNPDIMVMNAEDGSDVTRLTTNQAADAQGAWSPDSTQIVFVSRRGGNPDLWIMNADGSDQTAITQTESEELDPSWGE